ncbi:uncharacterized protein LOC141716659 isoform X2 [Apium graveolens]
MATMGELPSELLSYIILMLVQSPGGAADFARIVSVCRRFRLFTQDKHILNLVNFDMKMEFKNFIQYQHINNLLVKCSEAGNEAAQFLLGKVILVSSSQLFLGEWQKADFHPCDFFTLGELFCIMATNVSTQNHEVGSFISYFIPQQESTSEFSRTRLVHYQLVKLFLLNCSLLDFAEMSVFLKCYIKFFTSVTEEDDLLLQAISTLVPPAETVRNLEKLFMEPSCLCVLCSISVKNYIARRNSSLALLRALTVRFFERYLE